MDIRIVSKVIVTKIYVIISSSSLCLVYVLMTVIIKAFTIYSKYVVHGYCKLKLPFIFFVGQIYFQLVFFVASLLKVSFLPYSLLLMLMVCGRQAPRLVAGSEEVRAVR